MKTSTTFPVFSLLALLAACKPEPATQPPTQPEPPAPVVVAQPQPTPEPALPPAVWPDEPYRATRPTPGPVAELKLPKIESFKLANGLEVFLVPKDRLPTV